MINKLLVIVGPTATGKTDLGIYLAKKFNGEIIACDSRQVYRGLDIGTGKMPSGNEKWDVRSGKGFWEINGIKVWMYDVVNLKVRYTVADYIKDASKIIEKIVSKNKLPIIVGGTGLYLKGLLEGFSNLNIPTSDKLRRELESYSLYQLQTKLQNLSSEKWNNLNNSDRNNKRRLLRSIELILMYPYIKHNNKGEGISNKFDILKIGLTAPRDILYKKINSRVFDWLKQGIVDEVKNILQKGISKNRIKELGLEYAVILDYLEEKISYKQMIEIMQTKVRQYSKRQLTWFKKERPVFWFDIFKKIRKVR